jgi:hypothetical protein
MANNLAKGVERMRELGRRGGLKSGERRRRNAFTLRIASYISVWEATGQRFTGEEVIEAMRPPDLSSGDRDTDWRCPRCHRFKGTKRRACATCNAVPPANQRLTWAALRGRRAEHINGATVRRHKH